MKYPMPIRKAKKIESNNEIEIPKQSKYRNKKTTYNGIEFDSKKECERYKHLKYLEANEVIFDLELQKEFILQDKFEINGKTIQPIKYKADFCYYLNRKTECGIINREYIVEDVKPDVKEGEKPYKTAEYKLKKKMFMKRYGIEISEV